MVNEGHRTERLNRRIVILKRSMEGRLMQCSLRTDTMLGQIPRLRAVKMHESFIWLLGPICIAEVNRRRVGNLRQTLAKF